MARTTVLAHGMVTCLGPDVATACAAARAGIARSRAMDDPGYISAIDGEPHPVIAHEAPCVTQGFEGRARLERLLVVALRGLRADLAPGVLDAGAVALYVSMPHPNRILQGTALIGAQAGESHEDSGSAEPDHEELAGWKRMVESAARQAGFEFAPVLRDLSMTGHAGGAICLGAACDDLEKGAARVAIVCGVDSLLDEATLQWLHQTQRLKLDDMPVGLRPGEACAAVALAAEGAGLGDVVDITLSHEQRTLLEGQASVGVGLADALARTGSPQREGAWVVSDLNGEIHRANEWGHAVARLRGESPGWAEPWVWTPAEAFGDTGAASMLVGLCVALQAFARGYAPSCRAILAASSEGRERAAVVVERRELQVA